MTVVETHEYQPRLSSICKAALAISNSTMLAAQKAETAMFNYKRSKNELQKQILWINHAMRKMALAQSATPDLTDVPMLFAPMGMSEDHVLGVRAEFAAMHIQMAELVSDLSNEYGKIIDDLLRCQESCHHCLTMMDGAVFFQKHPRFNLI